jgi:pilus assembly protein FimV
MMRKLVMPTAAAILLVAVIAGASVAHAMGLGEIELKSALNEHLVAEIDLREVGRRNPDEIIARLASNEDFERVGVERYFYLSDLQFTLQTRPSGVPYIRVSSREPVVEPFLNFVVELRWPQGRMLKEYTLLLDPPTYAARPAPAIAAPERARPATDTQTGRIERSVADERSQVSLTPRPERPATAAVSSEQRLQGDRYGVTDRDDTLWRIASRSRVSSDVTVEQQMLAIVDLNPEAFIGGNINLLKAGYTLRLPSAAQARARAQAQAAAEVAVQNQDWSAWRRGEITQLGRRTDTAPRQAAQLDATSAGVSAPAPAERPVGEMRIVAAGEDDGAGSGSAGDDAATELEAQLAESEAERERMEQEHRAATERVDQLLAQVEQTQRQLEVRDQQLAILQQQLESVRNDAASPPTAGASVPSSPGGGDGPFGIAATGWALIGGTALAVLLAAAMVMVRRRQQEPEEPLAAYAGRTAPMLASAHVEADYRAHEEDTVTEDVLGTAGAVQAPERAHASANEIVEEADIYIAYGRFQQAEVLLCNALDEHPARTDLRLKLLEVYAATGDADAFARHNDALTGMSDDPHVLAAALEFESVLRAAQTAANGNAAPIESADDTSNAVAVDDFELTFDQEGDAATANGHTSADAAADSAPLEFRSGRSQAHNGDDLGGDLGIDFDPDADTENGADHTARTDANGSSRDEETDEEMSFDFDLGDLKLDGEDAGADAKNPSAPSRDDSFDFLDDGDDSASTKLDLARAYIDMGDGDGAREILDEVLKEGSDEQQQAARELLQEMA